jgi:Ribbon-helix-helix protein, copG family.
VPRGGPAFLESWAEYRGFTSVQYHELQGYGNPFIPQWWLWPVNSVNVTVRFGEDELRRLDELAQRMGKTRSDVIRDLISRFDEALREEVEKERRKWMTIGFVGALESAVLDPKVVLRFVRRNVDVLGYPDFLIGMVKVKNRVVVFSHHDKIGSQLLSLVRSRIEEDVRKEEEEVEMEDSEDEDAGGVRVVQVRVPASRPARPNTVHAIPAAAKYKLIITNKPAPPIARPTAAKAVGKPASNGGGEWAPKLRQPLPYRKTKNWLLLANLMPVARLIHKPGIPTLRPVLMVVGKESASPVGHGINHGIRRRLCYGG